MKGPLAPLSGRGLTFTTVTYILGSCLLMGGPSLSHGALFLKRILNILVVGQVFKYKVQWFVIFYILTTACSFPHFFVALKKDLKFLIKKAAKICHNSRRTILTDDWRHIYNISQFVYFFCWEASLRHMTCKGVRCEFFPIIGSKKQVMCNIEVLLIFFFWLN